MVNKVKSWWCNPGRWTVVLIYIGLAAWFLGMVLVNRTIQSIVNINQAHNMEMSEERANLQSQIDFLESQMPVRFPDGGP